MTWFYQDEGQEKGPFSKNELQSLINSKTINAKTLVRKETENHWRPLKDFARPKSQPQPQNPQTSPEPVEDEVVPQEDKDNKEKGKICSQCGRVFSQDEVVTYDNQIICSNCKPSFVQKVKEGANIETLLKYAGFWVRLGAKIIDGVIMMVLQWIILIPLSMVGFDAMMQNSNAMANNPSFFMYLGVQQLIGIAIPAIYTTFFLGKFAATPGKMVCGLKVVAPDGGRISYLRALGRNFAEWISAMILFIGYIMAAFDDEKRTLHDRICSTRVVHK